MHALWSTKGPNDNKTKYNLQNRRSNYCTSQFALDLIGFKHLVLVLLNRIEQIN